MLNLRVLTLLTMVLFAAATRFIPPLAAQWDPPLFLWNFTALGPMCLFGGAYFRRKWAALLAPMVALLFSDLVLAATTYGLRGFQVIWMSYFLFALTALMGMSLRGRVTFLRVGGMAISAAAMYFVLSNFQVWLTGHDRYPFTMAGLLACYVAALPFAQNMLLGNLFYSGVLFGGYELLSREWPALRESATLESATLEPATVKVPA